MPGRTRDDLARHVRLLRWVVNQQLEYDVANQGFVLPPVGRSPSFKAELMAASANFSGRRRNSGKAETASRGMHLRLQPGRVDGALP